MSAGVEGTELQGGREPPLHSVPGRHDVIRYGESEWSHGCAEQSTRVLYHSQQRIPTEVVPSGMSDQELDHQRQVGGPPVLSEGLRRQANALLSEDPAMKAVAILRRLTTDYGCTSGKTRFATTIRWYGR